MNETTIAGVVLNVALGLGLSAACGFRVFVPLLVLNLASRAGYLQLGAGFDWLGSSPALVVFGVATVLEVIAYYVPWLDHALDVIATPAAVVAGVIVTASVITGMDPWLKWTLALIAGGGLAGSIQILSAGTRGMSTLVTGGLGNPLVATAEAGGAVILSALAVVLPFAALTLIGLLLLFAWKRVHRRRPA